MCLLNLRIGLSNLGPGLAPPKTELPEQALALPDPQPDSKTVSCKSRQRLSIPQRTGQPKGLWFLAQRGPNRCHLCRCQAPRTARALAFHQTRQSLTFEPIDPILDGSRRISQKFRDLWALHPLRNQEYRMQPMVVAGFLGAPDFILQSEHDSRSIGDRQWFHASIESDSVAMRNYL